MQQRQHANYWVHSVDTIPDRKVHGANMGPIWGRQDPGGAHVGPMNFAIWVFMLRHTASFENRQLTWHMYGSQIRLEGQGHNSIKKRCLISIGNPIVEKRWSSYHLISTMGFPIVHRPLDIELRPRNFVYKSFVSTHQKTRFAGKKSFESSVVDLNLNFSSKQALFTCWYTTIQGTILHIRQHQNQCLGEYQISRYAMLFLHLPATPLVGDSNTWVINNC